MAKSIRSKWKRKCRAIKRERYGKKELDRLKKTLGIDDTQNGKDVDMSQISDVANVVKRPETNEIMETDEIKKSFNTKTLRNQHGAYPIWLHPRKISKSKVKKRKAKKGKKSKH